MHRQTSACEDELPNLLHMHTGTCMCGALWDLRAAWSDDGIADGHARAPEEPTRCCRAEASCSVGIKGGFSDTWPFDPPPSHPAQC